MTFTYRLERADGTPADPPTVRTAVPDMRPGDTIPIRPGRTLRVVGIVATNEDEPPILIVEDSLGEQLKEGVEFPRCRSQTT
jgi:hypothetical protein